MSVGPGTVAPGTPGVPAGGGSAPVGAPGTPAGPPAGGSATQTAEEQLAALRAETERKDHQIKQLLSEKGSGEDARREADRLRAELSRDRSAEDQLASDIQMVANPAASPLDQVVAAQGRLLQRLGSELNTTRNQVFTYRESAKATRSDPTLPPDVALAAQESFEAGYHGTIEQAINAEIGKRVREGTWQPPNGAAPGAAPVVPTTIPATIAQPVVAAPGMPVPVATMTRSVAPTAEALPATMTEAQYLALPPDQYRRAYAACRTAGPDGQPLMRVVPG